MWHISSENISHLPLLIVLGLCTISATCSLKNAQWTWLLGVRGQSSLRSTVALPNVSFLIPLLCNLSSEIGLRFTVLQTAARIILSTTWFEPHTNTHDSGFVLNLQASEEDLYWFEVFNPFKTFELFHKTKLKVIYWTSQWRNVTIRSVGRFGNRCYLLS